MQRRHRWRHLAGRALVATGFHAAVVTGIYPALPHAAVARIRRKRHLGHPPHEVRTLVEEVLATAVVHAARPVGLVGLPLILPQTAGPRPVILVHGLFMSRMNFVWLAQKLRLAGLGPIAGFEYWTLFSVRQSARELGDFVEEVCQRSGATHVDLVGHSMGGIVCRTYTQLDPRAAGRVAHVATIGSPHRGGALDRSPLGGLGQGVRDLGVGSDLLGELAATPIPAGVRAVNIWSWGDALVPGRRFAEWPGAEDIEYDDLGHTALLFSPRVARELIVRFSRKLDDAPEQGRRRGTLDDDPGDVPGHVIAP